MSFNQKIQKEINSWVNEGLISPLTGETLRARYPVTKRSMTQTLALLGSVLLGVGAILFFAANWQAMSRFLKVAVVVLSFTLSYTAGYYLRYHKKNYPKTGYALIFLGSLLYGSSIWLIAQIFHIEAEAGQGFLLWFLGVIPVAYLFHSSAHLTLALANLVLWFITGEHPLGWVYLFYPLLLGGIVLPLVLQKKSLVNLLAASIAAYIWFVSLGLKMTHFDYSLQFAFAGILLFSLLQYVLAQQLKGKNAFAQTPLLMLALAGLFVGFAPFTFHDFVWEFTQMAGLYTFPYLIGASFLLMAIIKLKEKKVGIADLPLLLFFLGFLPFFPAAAKSPVLLIINNLSLFTFTLLLLYYGYTIKSPHIFNLSMIMFAAAVALKYFDIFFALLPRSAFFISGGILLLVISFLLEYQRRNIIKAIERGEDS